jgi:hypothetical protein
VEGFVEWDKYDVAGRGASAKRPTTDVTALEPSPEWNWNGQITWTINSKTMLNVRNGGYTGYFPVDPTPPQTRSGPYPHFDGLTQIYTQNVPYYGRFDRNRNVTAATLTTYADHFAGGTSSGSGSSSSGRRSAMNRLSRRPLLLRLRRSA